ncbi:hypothetical protein [Pendulispora albinea]|uniref:TonB C-terminal domain-containing protein n=1 Tax=Pendulispora albinea TaxID=2741071 RepID=A0ABZ2M1Z5_9BACT
MIDASHAQTNGIHPGAPGIARASALMEREPLGRVFELGNRAGATIAVALLVASAVHGAAAARAALTSLELARFTRTVQAYVQQQLTETYEIEVTKPKEPEPPPPPEPEPEPVKAPPPPKAPKEAVAPPPAAAAAGAIIDKAPDPNEPVDLTNTFVTGPGTSYAGGTTQSGGTSTKPVYNAAARATGTPGGTGAATAPPGPSKARAAGLLGDTNWNDCPFPPEADSEDINETWVTIEVQVGVNGRAQGVTIVKDPGHGFARVARQCAMQKPFATELDVNGNAIPGKTKPFRIHFER